MIVHQISSSLKTNQARSSGYWQLFKENRIQLIASTISDTVEYGIYRVICSEPVRAYEVLKKAGISANLSDVFAIMLDNHPGRAADAVRHISAKGIAFSYLYSFMLGGKGILVFRTGRHGTDQESHLRKAIGRSRRRGVAIAGERG